MGTMRGTARTGTPAAARSGRRSDAPRPRQARYEEIARALRQAILDGKFPVGTKLPKENALSAQFAVSRQTIRAALQILREQGLVVTRRRTGTIVTPHQTDGSNFIHALSINDLVSFSNRWHFTIDSVEERGIDQELAAWADVPDDRPWLAIAGVAQFDRLGLPECWTTYYLEPEYASAGDLLRDLHSPILPMIEATFGVSVAEIEQEISAILLPRAIAERISAVVDEPAISVRRVCRTEAGGIVLVAIEVFPTSRFRYRFVVGRDSHSKG